VKVVILCGGRGTRIREISEISPKPMIDVGGFPILWHIMKYYSHWGHNDFVLCLGYKGELIKSFFLNYEANTRDFTISLGDKHTIHYHGNHHERDWRITLADTGLNAMTGARVWKVQRYLEGEENFMLTYGDGVGDIDLEALLSFHLSHGKIITVTGVRPPGRFGELACDSSGRALEFNEKPQASAGLISGGFFVCRKDLFKYLTGDDELVFEQEPLRRLVQDSQMMVYRHDGFWQPMDTPRDYAFLNELCERGKAPWWLW
jgi:glucose-1-phosphate cytidylyltransferase